MADIARLGIEINTNQVAAANTCLDELAEKGKKAKTATDYLKAGFESLNSSRVSSLIESLYDQLDVLEQTTEELFQYRLASQGATDAEIKEALAIQKAIEAREEINKLMEEGKELTRQYMSVEEKLAERKEHLTKLYNSGAISIGTYSKALADAMDKSKEVEAALKKIADGFESAGRKLSLLSAFIVGLGIASLKTAADIETQKASLEVLLGSTERAGALFEKIQKFSAATPFTLPELNSSTQKLLAFGVAEDAIIEKLNQLGNASQGNSQKFDSIVNAYGKIQAKGKASLEELNILTEAGFPILKQLEQQYGKTGEKLFKYISDGKVGIADINKAIESLTTGQGKFAGMMEKQAETLNGKLSTMTDSLSMAGAALVESLLPIIKDLVDWVISAANSFAGLDENTKRTILTIAGIVAVLGPTLILLSKLITTYNVLAPIIIAANAGFTGQALATSASTAATVAHTIATKAAAVAQAVFNAVINANPIALLITGAVIATTAVIACAVAIKDHEKKLKENEEQIYKTEKSYTTLSNAVKNFKELYKSATDDLVIGSKHFNSETRTTEAGLKEEINTINKEIERITAMKNAAVEAMNAKMKNIDLALGGQYKEIENLKEIANMEAYLQYLKDKKKTAIEKPKQDNEDYKKLLTSLQEEYDLIGKNEAATLKYKLEKENATEAQKKYTQAEIDAAVALQNKIDAKEKELKLEEEGKNLAEQYMTAQEKYAAQQEYLNELLKIGKINQEIYNKALEDAFKNTDQGKVVESIESLRKEYELLGKTKRELLENQLNEMNATDEQKKEALAIYDTIEAYEKKKLLKQKNKEVTEQYTSALKDLDDTGKIITDTFNELGKSLLNIGLDSLLDGFSMIGENLFAASDEMKSFTDILGDLGYKILQELPRLLLYAGVNLISHGNWPVGLALIAASGLVAIAAGAAKYVKEDAEEKAKENKSTTANALGNIYERGNIIPFARGSAFTNSIVSEPTFFRFADGTGLMGEAGAEAIIPLTRMPTGELGVKSQGQAAVVKITIINNSGQPVETNEKQNGDAREIEIVIGKTVNKQLSDGTYDKSLQQNYNIKRRGIAV